MPDYDVFTYTRPDGQVINMSDPPYMTEDYDNFGIGEFTHTTVAPPGTHGEYWYDTRMETKILTLTLVYHMDDATVMDRQDSRREIIRLFNPLLGPGVLRVDQVNGVSYEIDCILAESLPLPSDDFLGAGGYRTLVRFKSHGIPAFRDPNMNVRTVSGATGSGFSFPWSFPRMFAQSGFQNRLDVENVGDIESPVRITLRGPMINPLVKNETTNKTLSTVGLSLGTQDVLVIDTDPANYVFQVNGVDVWNYLQDMEFWDLGVGMNRIFFDVSGTTVATTGTIEWYTRYLGG